jgi:hypothetical protein
MSVEIARYQFHSWARRGISANISEPDDLGSGSSTLTERAEVPISVKLNGNAIPKNFALIGPGDIIGIQRDMIVRTEPLNWITDSEPNYLAFVEFYDEDFPWRYTPAAPQGEKLRPWVALLVLKEDEFERSRRRVPLPSITVKNQAVLPPFDETWLWAHVHSHADIPDSELSDYERFLLSLNRTVNDDPDQIFSRVLSPRKLEANTAYCGFVVPAFETGRLAGLEQPTAGVNAQMSAWDHAGPRGEMPVYFEWFFRTGVDADFEALVKLLEPRPMDKKVGIRDMDSSRPGFVQADDPTLEIPGTQPHILGLEGALKAPTTQSTVFPDPPEADDFQVELQKIVNLPETIPADLEQDPIISAPLYGKNHAKKSADDVILLDIEQETWVHDLNRDPRTRVAAGFGTLVVQKNQEKFMRKAWEQVARIIEANRRIKASRFMMSVAFQYTQKTFTKIQGAVLLAMSNPMLKKVKGSPATLYAMLRASRLPAAVFSGAFRRVARPDGALARRLHPGGRFNYPQLVEKLGDGRITASPPKQTPGGLFTTQDIADAVFPSDLPAWLLWLLKHGRLLSILLQVLFIILALLTGAYAVFGALAFAAVAALVFAGRLIGNANAAQRILDNQKQLESIQTVPPRPGFTLRLSDEATPPPPTSAGSGRDSREAANFRAASIEFNRRLAVKAPEKAVVPFDLGNAYAKVGAAIHPYRSFPLRLSALVQFPAYIDLGQPENLFPAMAYPDIEDPMYKGLSDISGELLLPNLQLIPPNTISLLKTNRKFIESYMVGLNHEMGGELLWREYPTDQRGSYFRQFWDVKGVIRPSAGQSEAELTELHKDIPPIDTWLRASRLGDHDKRAAAGDAEQLVLVVRGDLLKRYPNTLILAQKAVAGMDAAGESPVIDQDLDEDEFNSQVKFPLYKAEIAPDLKFFGFDLTIEQARGSEPTPGFDDDLGWFFILQEIPGEPRFGMDIEFDPGSDGLSWDDLAWDRFADPDLKFIRSGVRPNITPSDNTPDKWGTSSANMAYVLFQKPSMVAVHAKEMLASI